MPLQPDTNPTFRDNVAAIIRNNDGCILLGEIYKQPGFWSFPQGGVNRNETLRQALAREIREEAGLKTKDYKILTSRGNYHYFYPDNKLKKGLYHGQNQTYFLCQLQSTPEITLKNIKPTEFLRVAWLPPSQVTLQLFPKHKQQVMIAVFSDFFGIDLPPHRAKQKS